MGRRFLAAVLGVGLSAVPAAARADARPYVTFEDDGILASDFVGNKNSPTGIAKKVLAQYDKTGQPRPEILSVWTTFPMAKNDIGTYILPLKNDVQGIGLDQEYGGDGTMDEKVPPLRAVLLHNNVTVLDKRAKQSGAPNADGFAEYLFLLELSHVWGPAPRVPTSPGVAADGLIGLSFHWSFFVDAGGSPAGGNVWKSNGDGTFTTQPAKPGTLAYSMLDLYLMGLATKDEVPPFGLLTNVVVQGSPKDPFTKGDLTASSFPWFGDAGVTVKADRVAFTIDDVVKTNGPRIPAAGASPKSFKYGIALVVEAGATDEKRAAYKQIMDGVAAKLAPAFSRATSGRGTLEVVTQEVAPPPAGDDAGAARPDAGPSANAPSGNGGGDGGGCSAASREKADHTGTVAGGILLVVTMGCAARARRKTRGILQ